MDTFNYIPPTARVICVGTSKMMCVSYNNTESIVYGEEVDF